jgi:hypothetical protein
MSLGHCRHRQFCTSLRNIAMCLQRHMRLPMSRQHYTRLSITLQHCQSKLYLRFFVCECSSEKPIGEEIHVMTDMFPSYGLNMY